MAVNLFQLFPTAEVEPTLAFEAKLNPAFVFIFSTNIAARSRRKQCTFANHVDISQGLGIITQLYLAFGIVQINFCQTEDEPRRIITQCSVRIEVRVQEFTHTITGQRRIPIRSTTTAIQTCNYPIFTRHEIFNFTVIRAIAPHISIQQDICFQANIAVIPWIFCFSFNFIRRTVGILEQINKLYSRNHRTPTAKTATRTTRSLVKESAVGCLHLALRII